MYWTLELASYLSDAPWPATKDELIDYSIRTGAPLEVVENLQSNDKVIIGFIGNIKGVFTEFDLLYSLDNGRTWQIKKLEEPTA